MLAPSVSQLQLLLREPYLLYVNPISEYWIVDYAGLGGVQYIGSPKQPTITINSLIDGEYLGQRYRGEASIVSPTFPQLRLEIAQIIAMTEG